MNNIPLIGCTRVYLSIQLLKDILVPPSLGNNAYSCYTHLCANFCVDVRVQLLCMIAGLYGKIMFSFVKITKLFSKVAAPFCIPSSSIQEFLLLH